MDKIARLGYLAGATRFRRISEKLYVDGDRIYKDRKLPFKASWFSVFFFVATSEQPKTVSALAEEIGFTHITVKNVVRELEENGLVKVVTPPTDRRSRCISLSAKGKKLFVTLEKTWLPFGDALKQVLDAGHPDLLRMLSRIEEELARQPLYERISTPKKPEVQILDYKPSLKKSFYELAGPWLLEVLNGKLEPEDKFTLHNPDKAYVEKGGFVFFALLDGKVAGCVALKRMNEHTFEFAKLFVDKNVRNAGLATKLIARCITRCRENAATQLWLQTTMKAKDAHPLYYKLGFTDRKAPKQMDVLKRTEKIMVLDL